MTLYNRLRTAIDSIRVIDSHEHLPDEKERLGQEVDFFKLFSQYCTSDLVSAGMDPDDLHKLVGGITPAEKWKIFQPFYELIADGSYARAAGIAMEKFYGHRYLTSVDDAEAVSERIREQNKPGLYDHVLKEASGIEVGLVFGRSDVDRRHFRGVFYLDGLVNVCKITDVREVERQTGRTIYSLDDFIEASCLQLENEKERHGIVAVKVGVAYMRTLEVENVTRADAERVFNRIFDESVGWRDRALGYDEAKPLQDYVLGKLIEMAGALDLPVVIHTGIQASNWHRITDSRSTHLWPLFARYHDVRFNLLHAGLPWVEETATLVKYFGNVFVDLAWVHVISPEMAVRTIRTCIDLIPRNKMMGFGGDYCIVEKVYGHLTMARDNIARALAGKVEEGHLSEERALAWARALLHDNPGEFYGVINPSI